MGYIVSSIADMSTNLDRGRADLSNFGTLAAMTNLAWRERLSNAVTDSDKSKRAISLESGNGPGYVHSILNEGKEPTIDNLLAVCETLDVSAIYILYGLEVSTEEQELLRAVRDNPDKRNAILSLLTP